MNQEGLFSLKSYNSEDTINEEYSIKDKVELEKEEERKNKKKIFCRGILLGVAVAILGVLLLWQEGFYLNGKYYVKKGQRFVYNKEKYIERISEEQFEVHSGNYNYTVTLKRDGKHVTFTDNSDTIEGTWGSEVYSQCFVKDDSVLIVGMDNESGQTLIDAVCRIAFEEYEPCGPMFYVVLGLIIYMFGLVLLIYRKEIVQTFEFRYEKAELSYIGDLSVVIASIVIMVIGTGVMLGLYRFINFV